MEPGDRFDHVGALDVPSAGDQEPGPFRWPASLSGPAPDDSPAAPAGPEASAPAPAAPDPLPMERPGVDGAQPWGPLPPASRRNDLEVGDRPEAASLPLARPLEPGNGRVIAVWGPKGAPGRTTVALNLAFEAAPLAGETLLVDADTYGGSIAQVRGAS
jgi:Mrp family chromosome partitioning ATPase